MQHSGKREDALGVSRLKGRKKEEGERGEGKAFSFNLVSEGGGKTDNYLRGPEGPGKLLLVEKKREREKDSSGREDGKEGGEDDATLLNWVSGEERKAQRRLSI